MSDPRGDLILVANTLDFGAGEPDHWPDIQDTLPLGLIRTAARLQHWVAENARTTRVFLKRVHAVVPLAQPLQSIQIVELPRGPKGALRAPPPDLRPLLEPLLAGHDVGLISEAGLPAVADPGAALVQAAHDAGLRVVTLAGPSSLTLALAASGQNGQSFAFVGYLPIDGPARAARIRELEGLSRKLGQTQLMIETPYRNVALLDALLTALQPGSRLSVSCGLTLPTAWTRSDTIARWRSSPSTLPNDLPSVFALLAG